MKPKFNLKKLLSLLLSLLLLISLFASLTSCREQGGVLDELTGILYEGGEAAGESPEDDAVLPKEDLTVDEDGEYDDVEHVALYIRTYGALPKNYISKKDAEKLGWEGGSLDKIAPGKCIGGSYFGNYEGLLPTASGRTYRECDIDTIGKKSRGAKRIVYSNDGLIYYTSDHYETFTLLYGEE